MKTVDILWIVLLNFISGLLVIGFVTIFEKMGNSCSSSLIDMSWSGMGTLIIIALLVACGCYYYATHVRQRTKRRVYRDNGFDMDLYAEFEAYRSNRSRRKHMPAITYEPTRDSRPSFPLHPDPTPPYTPSPPSSSPNDELASLLRQLLSDRRAGPTSAQVHIADPSARRTEWNKLEDV